MIKEIPVFIDNYNELDPETDIPEPDSTCRNHKDVVRYIVTGFLTAQYRFYENGFTPSIKSQRMRRNEKKNEKTFIEKCLESISCLSYCFPCFPGRKDTKIGIEEDMKEDVKEDVKEDMMEKTKESLCSIIISLSQQRKELSGTNPEKSDELRMEELLYREEYGLGFSEYAILLTLGLDIFLRRDLLSLRNIFNHMVLPLKIVS
jgi:hypothetical protein